MTMVIMTTVKNDYGNNDYDNIDYGNNDYDNIDYCQL